MLQQLFSNSSCEDCLVLDNTFLEIERILKSNNEITDEHRNRYLSLFLRHTQLIQEWKKHQIRSVHQDAARDAVLSSLDETSVRNHKRF